jgi:MFS family permease
MDRPAIGHLSTERPVSSVHPSPATSDQTAGEDIGAPADPSLAPSAPPPPAEPPAREDVSYSQVLANTHFRNILFSQFISNLGTWVEAFAIQMFVAKATGLIEDQGILGFCSLVPIFLFGTLGGLLADRVNRRTLLIVTQLMAGAVAGGVAVVSWMFDRGMFDSPRTAVNWLFILAAINGVVMAFNFPAWQVLTPRLVPKSQLTRAIAMNGIQFNLARAIGPAVGGAILAAFTSTPLLIFNACTFVMMAMVVMTTPDAPAPPRTGVPIIGQLKQAWSFIIHQRGPRAVFFAQVLISFLAAPLVRLLSQYVIDVYHLAGNKPLATAGMVEGTVGPAALSAETAAGYLLAVQGIGAAIGGLALRAIPVWYPKHHFIPLAISSLGLSIAIFALTTSVWAGYGVMFVVGFFWIWSFNQSWAAMQVLAPDDMRGRVLSITTVASFGSTAVGSLLAGKGGQLLIDLKLMTPTHATQTVVAALGVPLFVGGLYMLMHRTPEVDGMPRMPQGTRPSRNILHAALASEHNPRNR